MCDFGSVFVCEERTMDTVWTRLSNISLQFDSTLLADTVHPRISSVGSWVCACDRLDRWG